jgi:hypothetical protein
VTLDGVPSNAPTAFNAGSDIDVAVSPQQTGSPPARQAGGLAAEHVVTLRQV